MNNKDTIESLKKMEAKTACERDLKEFTKAALQGLCANPDLTNTPAINLGYRAVDLAEAALAELEKRNG